MKTLLAILMVLCSAIPAMADVTKSDMKKLISAGVSDQVMVDYIKANGPVLMSASDLADLKTLGASDGVLSALVAGLQGQKSPQTTVIVEAEPVVYTYSYWYWGGYYCYPRYYYRPYYRPVYRPTVVVRPVVRPCPPPRIVRHR